ncbi:MAG TPA: DUF3368 domain-containing protein [Pirellulales bacterium]
MPVVVISDASPVRALNHLGLLTLCRDLYGTVIVPEAVQEELRRPTTTCCAIELSDYSWFEIRRPSADSRDLGVPSELDAGETQAIALAMELHADLILIDERKAASAARGLGLTAMGVLGVLLEAKRKNLLDLALPCVDRLVSELNFFVSPALRERFAQLADE